LTLLTFGCPSYMSLIWPITGVGAGTSRIRDKQFTSWHSTYSHCRLRLLQHNYRWQ